MELCVQRGDSYRRKKREGEWGASSLSDSTKCDVGCRAAVLLHVMLMLSWVSSQHVWTVLQDKKPCCTTVRWATSLWHGLGRGKLRAGAWGHDFVLS